MKIVAVSYDSFEEKPSEPRDTLVILTQSNGQTAPDCAETRHQSKVIAVDRQGRTVTVKTPVGIYTEPYDVLVMI